MSNFGHIIYFEDSLCNSYKMCTSDLPEIYTHEHKGSSAQHPSASAYMKAKSQLSVHVITNISCPTADHSTIWMA